MHALLRTAGERVELRCRSRWLTDVLRDGAAGECVPPGGEPADVRVTVEDEHAAFDTRGWAVLTRGAWSKNHRVTVANACSSGLDLQVAVVGSTVEVTARWRPPTAVWAAATVLRARAVLLLRAVLLQYPALWRAGLRGRVPLHAAVCSPAPDPAVGDDPTGKPARPTPHTRVAGPPVLLAGPGGVGKTTVLAAELARGAVATCDNLCVTDGSTAWGLVEPLRLPTDRFVDRGRRMPHGRRETRWPRRVDALTPGRIIVLVRDPDAAPAVTCCPPDEAARQLTAGTYMAGELRRYWGFAATLALGTGAGPIHPPVGEVAATLAARLPCRKATLNDRSRAALRDLVDAAVEAEVNR